MNKPKRCRTCRKSVVYKDGVLKEGICQIGQGANKPILTFCNEKCRDVYEDSQNVQEASS